MSHDRETAAAARASNVYGQPRTTPCAQHDARMGGGKKGGRDFLFITFSVAGTAEKYIFPRPRAAVTVLFQLAV
jgi:hypothetical protein